MRAKEFSRERLFLPSVRVRRADCGYVKLNSAVYRSFKFLFTDKLFRQVLEIKLV